MSSRSVFLIKLFANLKFTSPHNLPIGMALLFPTRSTASCLSSLETSTASLLFMELVMKFCSISISISSRTVAPTWWNASRAPCSRSCFRDSLSLSTICSTPPSTWAQWCASLLRPCVAFFIKYNSLSISLSWKKIHWINNYFAFEC